MIMKSLNISFLSVLLIFYFSYTVIAQPPYPEWKQYIPVYNVWNMKLNGNTLYATTWGSGLIALDLNTNKTQVFSMYSAGIASDKITAIDVDGDGNIWLGHDGYGISKLSDNVCTIFNTENSGLINDTIKTLCVDLNGKIWIGTWKGISTFDGQNWQSYTHSNSELPNDTVSVIVTDEENNKWIGLNGGFAIFDDNSWEIHDMYPPSSYVPIIENIVIDENGTAWIDTHQYNSALYKFNGDSIEFMNWPPTLYNYISDMKFDNEGNLWMSIWSGMNDFGLAMYDGNAFIEYDFSELTDYLSNLSQSLVIDANDNKWIGSMEDGLLKYKEEIIEQINEGIFGLHSSGKMAIENNNRIWIAAYHGLSEYDSGEWSYYSYYNSEYPAEYSNCVAIDINDKKWIGAGYQLIIYDDTNWYVYDTTNSPIEYGYPYIENIVIDKNDIKWFTKKGLYKFDNETWTVYNTENSAIPSNDIHCLAVDSSGVVWLGHLGIGVSSFDGNNWNLFDTTIVGPQLYFPRSIYVDSINTKWICTQDGLSSFDGVSWSVFDTSNTGLPSNVIMNCMFDNKGKMWVGTKKGIGVYDGNTWMIYDSTNSSLKRNSIRNLYKSDNNTIWISTYQGGISVYNENGFLDVEEYSKNIASVTKMSSFPNPFFSETNIRFNLHKPMYGEIIIYNLIGQKIKIIHKGELFAGENNFRWDGKNDNGKFVENGIYFCQLYSTKPIGTCKLILIRK